MVFVPKVTSNVTTLVIALRDRVAVKVTTTCPLEGITTAPVAGLINALSEDVQTMVEPPKPEAGNVIVVAVV